MVKSTENSNIGILDDTYSVNTLEKVGLYLRYHFGSFVNLSILRNEHQHVYRVVSILGKLDKRTIYEVISDFGLVPVYNTKWRKKED